METSRVPNFSSTEPPSLATTAEPASSRLFPQTYTYPQTYSHTYPHPHPQTYSHTYPHPHPHPHPPRHPPLHPPLLFPDGAGGVDAWKLPDYWMTIVGMHGIFCHPNTVEARPAGPRAFRQQRRRARPRFAADAKASARQTGDTCVAADSKASARPPGQTCSAAHSKPSARQPGETPMDQTTTGADEEQPDPEPPSDDLIDRASLCLPHFGRDSILHRGDDGFKEALREYFPANESNASERLVDLKIRLRAASTHDFWGILMEEMCAITSSQCGFVAKRMLVDDQDSAVEMPELGEPGSCLMGVAFYVNDGSSGKKMYRDYRYHAYGSPCAHMRHDKVFIVPERMTEFLPDNPNPMPWERSEAFIGVPLFTDGRCFAHFGMIWSAEGARARTLSWSFIEMFLHSLEDMILQRILEGRGFAKEVAPPESTAAKVIPLSAITASQSLKPYARSLSHELRTPMQGVVGMLDIMYSTVLDAISAQQSERVKAVFQDLKSHIEMVQDSSRRAVEAADNVVHAYDLNMQMPETPLSPSDVDVRKAVPPVKQIDHPNPTELPGYAPAPTSRKHDRTGPAAFAHGPPVKRIHLQGGSGMPPPRNHGESTLASSSTTLSTDNNSAAEAPHDKGSLTAGDGGSRSTPAPNTPTHRHVVTRTFMQGLLNDALRNDHPMSMVRRATGSGETFEITTKDARGDNHERVISLNIESDIPHVVIMEEQYLQFAVKKLVDNALKFTEHGKITVTVKLARNSQVMEIWVADTGCGIAESSKTNLFKPHFQEDPSISRSRDGLGLSLFNAKAHIRKNLGGDLTLERSDTDGPRKGSEFLIRLPVSNLSNGLDKTFSDIPLVGSPPATIYHADRPSPWIDSSSLPNPLSSNSVVTPQQRIPKPPRKRATFNPNLATECPLKILVAEDNAINRNVAVGSLNKLGYRGSNVTIAVDGLEAVKKFEACLSLPREQRFDAVLMDIWMPNMDGYEATTEILALARGKGMDTKVIAVTADITEDSVSKAKAAGMRGFLAKPYKVLDIERMIVEHFARN